MSGSEGVRLSPLQRSLRWTAAGGIAAVLAALFLWPPESLLPVSCTFRQLTGLSCLTCGMTRSFHSLLHGDILGSINYHLMGPVLLAASLYFCGLWGMEAARGQTFRLPFTAAGKRMTAAAVAVIWIGYWIVRIAGELS